ncbi:hypothetical protein CB1_000328003 [Camelus ferus]|nr:hypothetical protein CB1_000328003 [Camelus ferus]
MEEVRGASLHPHRTLQNLLEQEGSWPGTQRTPPGAMYLESPLTARLCAPLQEHPAASAKRIHLDIRVGEHDLDAAIAQAKDKVNEPAGLPSTPWPLDLVALRVGKVEAAFLSQTDSDIRALFLGIDGLCRKYSMETSQVSEFQEKHRRRLLAFYGEKISSLEESLRKSALQLEQLQSSFQQPCVSKLRKELDEVLSPPTSLLLVSSRVSCQPLA